MLPSVQVIFWTRSADFQVGSPNIVRNGGGFGNLRYRTSTAKQYRVRVIRNRDSWFYIGLSEDPAHRLEQHNRGESHWTKSRGPWELVWTSKLMSLTEARKLENQLKRQKRGKGFYRLIGLPYPSAS